MGVPELGVAGVALAVIVGLALVVLVIEAVFIHLGACLIGLRQATFGRAFKAALFIWLLQLALSCLTGVVMAAFFPSAVAQGGFSFAVSLLAGTLAVKTAYDEGFVKSMLAYLLALILTTIVVVGLVFALLALGVLGAATSSGGGTVAL